MFEGTGSPKSSPQNPPLAFVTLFGAGLVTSLTPCVYPMIRLPLQCLRDLRIMAPPGRGWSA